MRCVVASQWPNEWRKRTSTSPCATFMRRTSVRRADQCVDVHVVIDADDAAAIDRHALVTTEVVCEVIDVRHVDVLRVDVANVCSDRERHATLTLRRIERHLVVEGDTRDEPAEQRAITT